MPKAPEGCEWTSLKEALLGFVRGEFSTTSQRHIRPLHWYMACRLCLEGGFDPGEITPRPPFRVNTIGSGFEPVVSLSTIPARAVVVN